ncbi:hypothetical protein DFS33DRAFT_1298850 [Desarmillaria ectypa]|nr:hypothetical protein DFS33DRAFT_1298850 [Desarmillaria ectypa]
MFRPLIFHSMRSLCPVMVASVLPIVSHPGERRFVISEYRSALYSLDLSFPLVSDISLYTRPSWFCEFRERVKRVLSATQPAVFVSSTNNFCHLKRPESPYS